MKCKCISAILHTTCIQNSHTERERCYHLSAWISDNINNCLVIELIFTCNTHWHWHAIYMPGETRLNLWENVPCNVLWGQCNTIYCMSIKDFKIRLLLISPFLLEKTRNNSKECLLLLSLLYQNLNKISTRWSGVLLDSYKAGKGLRQEMISQVPQMINGSQDCEG